MSRAFVLQHAPHEGPGRVAELLAERGFDCDVRHLYRGDAPPPAPAAGEPVIVMGGPMGVGDAGDARYPFLAGEIAFLRTLVSRDHPVLGVCLGAQLLAAAAGARVYPNPVREVGWGPVDFIGVDREPALAGLSAREMMLHWHGDTYDLPAGAAHLASTPACRHQAFRVGRRQFGLQFHCELAPATIAAWVDADADYVRGAGTDGARILADTDRWFAPARPVWDRLLRNIIAQLLAP
jgi:GMP synthase-like glutamine amidotransferase